MWLSAIFAMPPCFEEFQVLATIPPPQPRAEFLRVTDPLRVESRIELVAGVTTPFAPAALFATLAKMSETFSLGATRRDHDFVAVEAIVLASDAHSLLGEDGTSRNPGGPDDESTAFWSAPREQFVHGGSGRVEPLALCIEQYERRVRPVPRSSGRCLSRSCGPRSEYQPSSNACAKPAFGVEALTHELRERHPRSRREWRRRPGGSRSVPRALRNGTASRPPAS